MRFASALTLRHHIFFLAVAGGIAATAACAGTETRECRVGADCISGMCGADGTCAPGPAATASSSGSSGVAPQDGGQSTETGASILPPDDGGGYVQQGCTANKDGTITRDEVPIKPGLHATFRVATDVDISTAGTPTTNGRRKWDLSIALSGESNILVETVDPAGAWFASSYANATYTTTLSKSSDLMGVFETAPGSLVLRGEVSPADGTTKTELTNDPPVSMLVFPLTLNQTWTTDTKVTGTAQGLTVAYSEKYDASVDAAGDLITPLGTFDVLRVRIDLTRTFNTFPAYSTTSRSYAFVTECYGNVASIVSDDNETNVEFTHASEVRRIAP